MTGSRNVYVAGTVKQDVVSLMKVAGSYSNHCWWNIGETYWTMIFFRLTAVGGKYSRILNEVVQKRRKDKTPTKIALGTTAKQESQVGLVSNFDVSIFVVNFLI